MSVLFFYFKIIAAELVNILIILILFSFQFWTLASSVLQIKPLIKKEVKLATSFTCKWWSIIFLFFFVAILMRCPRLNLILNICWYTPFSFFVTIEFLESFTLFLIIFLFWKQWSICLNLITDITNCWCIFCCLVIYLLLGTYHNF